LCISMRDLPRPRRCQRPLPAVTMEIDRSLVAFRGIYKIVIRIQEGDLVRSN
jgi:hypothetical protein